ncbi:hypothetical protein H0H81_012082 [Sphagnurus paluster]|uniref:Transcription initiation factor TFIID subunit 11 n=1 Tax=Sphagnurus paluster TaxID=117069 RepID=A0A9P7FRZ8_9AGAR|nr:hypothetical protein H0H81_012082 [Sphagnurus paluster]
MNPPSTPYTGAGSPAPETPGFHGLSTPTPAGRGRHRGALTGTGAKRGRKPRGGATGVGTTTPRMSPQASTSAAFSTQQYSQVHWAMPGQTAGASGAGPSGSGSTPGTPSTSTAYTSVLSASQTTSTSYTLGATGASGASALNFALPSASGLATTTPSLDTTGLISMTGAITPVLPVGAGPGIGTGAIPASRPHGVGDEDGDGDDEMLPAMADDDYSAQLSWQSQSKDNLKVLMDNFSPEQYDRFEAYRRHALPKAAVRKVIQQTLGQQVSQPVAQIVAGFAKVFVGEIVEKARAVQTRRGETGPLSPDHLREAYRIYQDETGRVGAARPLRSKKLFVR